MRGAPFMALCLRYGLNMNDLTKYGPLVNYSELDNKKAEKFMKQIKRKKDRALGHGSIWTALFGFNKA